MLVMPPDEADWITHDETGLTTRRCAYWLNLLGRPSATQGTKVPVAIPTRNVLTPAALRQFLSLATRREELPDAI